MKTIDLGAVMMVPKGDWSRTVTYERNNLVRHNSAAWVCKVATSIGVEPTANAVDWYRLVEDSTGVSSVNGMTGDVTLDVTPNSHASVTTEFGVGTETEYGHLRLTDNVDTVAAGVAIAPSAVKTIKEALEAAITALTLDAGETESKATDAYDKASSALSLITALDSTVTTVVTNAGNAINNLAVDGKVITFTRNNGTTGTISTQDTDTNTKVTNTLATTSKAYITGTTSNKTNTGTQVFDTGVYLTTTAGVLHADKLEAGAGTIWVA